MIRLIGCVVMIGFSVLAAGIFGGAASQTFYKYEGVATLPISEYNALAEAKAEHGTLTIKSTGDQSVTFYYKFYDSQPSISGITGDWNHSDYRNTIINQIIIIAVGIFFTIGFWFWTIPKTLEKEEVYHATMP